MSDWRDEAWAKLPEVEENLGVKPCVSVPCPPFGETTLEVERCPTCGKPDLKWHPAQSFDCPDAFHDVHLRAVARPHGDDFDALRFAAHDYRYQMRLTADDPPPEIVVPDWYLAKIAERFGSLAAAGEELHVRIRGYDEVYGGPNDAEGDWVIDKTAKIDLNDEIKKTDLHWDAWDDDLSEH